MVDSISSEVRIWGGLHFDSNTCNMILKKFLNFPVPEVPCVKGGSFFED